MKVLVIGGGGREHAMAWKLAQSNKVQTVFVAPGNGGTALDKRLVNVPITDLAQLRDWALAEKIGLSVVGPEGPLAAAAPVHPVGGAEPQGFPAGHHHRPCPRIVAGFGQCSRYGL